MSAAYTREEILRQLDESAARFTFPGLDNGYIYPGTVRLSAYLDAERWALVIEVVGYNPRAGAHDGLQNCLHLYGNCLKRPPGTANEDFLNMTGDGPDGPTFDEACDSNVRPEARSIRIRDRVLPLDVDLESLAGKGIELVEPPDVTGADLMRSLLPEHRDLLLATEEELRQRVPADLPLVLRLDEWHHPDVIGKELPSQNATFQMIADVLVIGDPTYYHPVSPPNTHWKNWPEGGTL
jgi:hypothetical protein